MLKQDGGWWQILLGAAIASASLAVLMGQSPNRSDRVALYASVGEELSGYAVDVERATLTKQSSVTLPGFVQEAWASPSTPYLYVAWSNGGASYAGTGVPAAGDKHGVTAFRIDSATGALQVHGAAATIRSRPIHITGDMSATHLLVAYNDPSGISVHTINRDGTVGPEIPQPNSLDVGVYAHQVRVMPTNRSVILVTRGNQATSTTAEDPGALKVLRYDEGRLANLGSIAPAQGREFRSRHLDFHPTRPWVFLTIESQNRLQVFARIKDDMLSAQPLFSKSTLANGGGVSPGQSASTVHVHPDGQFVYVGNRNSTALSAGGTNDIAVFRINQQTGEPSLIENVDTRGVTPRTFSIDPAGRLLVVGNQTTLDVPEGTSVRTIPANLAVFRIQQDGRLEFVRRYDVAVGRKPLWWAGLVALPQAAGR
jgi:6-phosphogluconolactonase (cycloisomerase 2 family)